MKLTLHVAALLLIVCICSCSRGGEVSQESPKPAATQGSNTGGTPVELSYVPEGFPMGLSVSQGFALHLFETPSASQKFREMPPESGRKRYYDEFTIAGKSHLVITEEGSPPLMHFDENRNGDLTDDRGPFTGEKDQLLPNNYSIQIRYDAEKVIAPYRMWLFGSNMGGVRFYSACHWRGNLEIDGARYIIVAFDGGADGDYSNDPLVIDVNGNDKADEGESMKPGDAVQLGGREVRLVSVSPSGLTAYLMW